MRGGYLHNMLLIGSVQEECERRDIKTATEGKVSDGIRTGYIDLVIEGDGYQIAVEAELTSKRIDKDMWKARLARVDELWLLVPNKRIEKSLRRRLARLPRPSEELAIYVLPLGGALKELSNRFSLIFMPNQTQKTNKERDCS